MKSQTFRSPNGKIYHRDQTGRWMSKGQYDLAFRKLDDNESLPLWVVKQIQKQEGK